METIILRKRSSPLSGAAFDKQAILDAFDTELDTRPEWEMLDGPYVDRLLVRSINVEIIRQRGTLNPVTLKPEQKSIQLLVPVVVQPIDEHLNEKTKFYDNIAQRIIRYGKIGMEARHLWYDIDDLVKEYE